MILVRKIYQNTRIFNDICPKIKKKSGILHDFCPKKMPEFYIIIARKIFFQNLPSAPVSYAYMILTTVCMTGGSVGS